MYPLLNEVTLSIWVDPMEMPRTGTLDRKKMSKIHNIKKSLKNIFWIMWLVKLFLTGLPHYVMQGFYCPPLRNIEAEIWLKIQIL